MRNQGLALILLLLAMSISLIPLATISFKTKTVDLYYETPDSTAPVIISYSGSAHEYKSSAWLHALRGYWRGYRSMGLRVTLSIGNYSKTLSFSRSRVRVYHHDPDIEFSVNFESPISGTEGYVCSYKAYFEVPARLVVQNWEPLIDPETEEPYEDRGAVPFSIYSLLQFTGPTEAQFVRFGKSHEGTAIIHIVGDIRDYLPEGESPEEAMDVPEEEPPEEDLPESPAPEDLPEEGDDVEDPDLELQDSEVTDEEGGSQISTSLKGAFLQLSIPTLVTIALIVVVFIYSRRG